ncbi:MAG: hypothetical protein KC505_01960 [Myxococcales bacterium]|nr:hypothetical protein [Myxococcales bacterium]USN51229.1 MAG: hypothetical protein H6731_02135 [Myxococcales bacterium]
MKLVIKIGCLAASISSVIIVSSCGNDDLLQAYLAGRRSKQEAPEETKLLNESQRNEDLHSELSLASKSTKNSPQEKTNNSTSIRKESQLSENDDNYVGPFIGQLPYYCNPLRYPAHIINTAKACRPYLRKIYQGQSYPWTEAYDGYDGKFFYDPADRLYNGYGFKDAYDDNYYAYPQQHRKNSHNHHPYGYSKHQKFR